MDCYSRDAFCSLREWPEVRRSLFCRTLALAHLDRNHTLRELRSALCYSNVARSIFGYIAPPLPEYVVLGKQESALELDERIRRSGASIAARVVVDARACGTFNDARLAAAIDAARPNALYELLVERSGPGSKRSGTRLTPAALELLGAQCPHLHKLRLPRHHWIAASAFEQTLPRCSELAVLELPFAVELGDDALCAIAAGCRCLRELDVTQAGGVGDEALRALALRCPLLERLSVAGCALVTDVGVVAIAVGCGRLREVNIGSCDAVTDRGVVALGQHCAALRAIDFSFLPEITDGSIITVAAGCPFLRCIILDECELLTDAAIVTLCEQSGPHLRRLQLDSLSRLTELSIAAVAEYCVNIEHISCHHCSRLERAGGALYRLRRERGGLVQH
jgi:F-box/leucine-rich repeat protein 2/20